MSPTSLEDCRRSPVQERAGATALRGASPELIRIQSREAATRYYRIGVVQAALTSDLPALYNDYARLYLQAQVSEPMGPSIQVRVSPQPFSWRHRRRFEVTVNDRVQFQPARREELLPYVEWAINWEVPRLLPQCLHLHASSLSVNGGGVILPGVSGSGKSTLTTGLLSRGWQYLCDEFAIIEPSTLRVQPYPRAICIKKPSFAAVASVGLSPDGHRHYLKGSKGWVGFINPARVHPRALGAAAAVRHIIFPRYSPGAAPVLRPLHRADAAFALHRVCFNLLDCRTPALDIIARLVRDAECFELVSGELRATCDLLQELVERDRERDLPRSPTATRPDFPHSPPFAAFARHSEVA